MGTEGGYDKKRSLDKAAEEVVVALRKRSRHEYLKQREQKKLRELKDDIEDDQKARVLNNHTAAVKDAKWSAQGLSVLSCGYDCTSRLVDIEKGIETHVFEEDQVVGVVKFHPKNHNLFISGGSKGQLKLSNPP